MSALPYLLGKKLVHLIRMSKICDASSVSLNSGVPLAIRHHFSCGSCCNERHPSIPIAQHRVLELITFWFHSSFNFIVEIKINYVLEIYIFLQLILFFYYYKN